MHTVSIGIKGTVVALDRATGQEVWRSNLRGSDFVNVVLQDADLYATAGGELFCLDPTTGRIKWHNPTFRPAGQCVRTTSVWERAMLLSLPSRSASPAGPDRTEDASVHWGGIRFAVPASTILTLR